MQSFHQRNHSASGYKQTEVGVIPEDWDVFAATQVCELVVDCKNRTPPVVDEGDYAVVRTPNVRNGKFIRDDLRFTDEPSFREWTARAVPQIGDVLITREAPLGEVCLVPSEFRVCLGQRMMLYRPDRTKVASRYLLYSLMSVGVQSNLLRKLGGSTVGHAKVDDIRYLQIPLPPTLAEQRAIAEALGDADALIESLEQLIAKKRAVKQGAMQELLRPKAGWVAAKLGSLGAFLKGSGVKKDDTQSGDIPCIRYGEIYTKHSDYIKTFYSWISPAVAATARRLKVGDVLFAGSGETKEEIGKCVAFVDDVIAYAGGDIVILRPEKACALFLGYYLNTATINRQKASRGQGDAVVHIGSAALANIDLTLPPSVDEQTAIAAVLSDMDAEIAELEAKLVKARQVKQGMMQELLTGRVRLV
ncbi:restriction endonuclease subunit S [Oscillochloris sp. ZM17-4]|uniref:restriction endonuclease subunit S n=1 Tax=Oscillochloris sp. ZM17-4 TaxID=2866714 RepID=UPI001C7392D4|nr:restriction endonuclease subunit S [Oscillochloris sp. ZM17-4]MBX0328396.1 restriction endonuclease subunit S [Oscillochloris sp. ZM17-4]